jgi:hypothetical protein
LVAAVLCVDAVVFAQWRKQRARERVDERTRTRIVSAKPRYAVNAELAAAMQARGDGAGDSVLADERFGQLFTDPEFAIDANDETNMKRLTHIRTVCSRLLWMCYGHRSCVL